MAFNRYPIIFQLGGSLISLPKPSVMGIINLTEDSFYHPSRVSSSEGLGKRICSMLQNGADLIDFGAFSSRPGALIPDETTEAAILIPALRFAKNEFPNLLISVDTFRLSVIERVFDAIGPFLINDIYGGRDEPGLFGWIGKMRLPYLLMHMKGDPVDMQDNAAYSNPVKEIIWFMAQKISQLRLSGVSDIFLDPGFGFGKSLDDNYLLLNHLNDFDKFQLPIVVGISRKSMIYKLIESDPLHALPGSLAATSLAVLKGAGILRVHDVQETIDLIRIINHYQACS